MRRQARQHVSWGRMCSLRKVLPPRFLPAGWSTKGSCTPLLGATLCTRVCATPFQRPQTWAHRPQLDLDFERWAHECGLALGVSGGTLRDCNNMGGRCGLGLVGPRLSAATGVARPGQGRSLHIACRSWGPACGCAPPLPGAPLLYWGLYSPRLDFCGG